MNRINATSVFFVVTIFVVLAIILTPNNLDTPRIPVLPNLPDSSGFAVHPIYGAGYALPFAYSSSSVNTFLQFSSVNANISRSFDVSDTVIYNLGYVSYDGQQWQPFTLTSTNAVSGAWIFTKATASVSFTPAQLRMSLSRNVSNNTFVVVYSCSRISGAWVCHDGWQIIKFDAKITTSTPTPTPVCTANAQECLNSTVYRKCNSAGTAWVNTNCLSGQTCTNGNCITNSGTAWNFIAWGDTKMGYATLTTLSNQVLAYSPKLTIYAGDLQDEGFNVNTVSTWKNAFNGGANNGIFDKTFLVRGNHETYYGNGDTSASWQSYFNFGPKVTAIGGSNYNYLSDSLTYSFDYQNAHFIGLDINPNGDESMLDHMSSAQVTWLNADLTAAENRGIIHSFIWYHPPLYWDGSCGSKLPAVIKNHPSVKAVFAGHQHQLAANNLNTKCSVGRDVYEFITAGTGADLYSCTGTDDWCEDTNYGFAVISVNGNTATLNFYKQGSSSSLHSVTLT